jgi:hypothetical protein
LSSRTNQDKKKLVVLRKTTVLKVLNLVLARKLDLYMHGRCNLGQEGYRGVPLERVIENTHFTAFPYQFELFNQPF